MGSSDAGPPHGNRLESLYNRALDLPPEQRSGFLDRECAGEPELRAGVETLLAHYDAAGEISWNAATGRAVWSPPAVAEDEPLPERIGQYRITRRIGEGGMGVVFEGWQAFPPRKVAVKLIRPGLQSDRHARRFDLEGRMLARLRHPGIAHVYETGAARTGAGGLGSPVPYIAMEFIEGEPLHEYVRRGRLEPRAIIELLARVCDAVEHAHQRGVIHRDLKPGNILVEEGGQPKILDFGVARALDPEDRMTLETGLGEVIGTLPYMSPEQVGAGDVDTRSDVYAIGAILFELLSGRPPIDVDRVPLPEALRRIREHPIPRLREVRHGVGEEVSTLVGRALDKDPARRYASAHDLAADLRRYLAGEPIEAKRDSTWYVVRKQIQRHRVWVASGVAFVLLLAASTITAWTLYRSAEQARRVAARESDAARERLWEVNLERARAGRAGSAIGRRSEGLRALAEAAAIRPTLELRNEAIACLALSDLALENAIAGEFRRASSRFQRRADRFAYARPEGGVEVRRLADGSVLHRLAGPDLPVTHLRFDPSARYLGVKYHLRSDVRVWIWDLERGAPVIRIGPGDTAVEGVVFSPGDGPRPWAAVNTEGQLRFVSLPDSALLGAVPLRPGRLSFAADPRGERVAVVYRPEDRLYIVDVASGRVTGTLEAPAPFSVDWSPGGTRVAVGSFDNTVRVWNLAGPDAPVVLQGHLAPVFDVAFVDDDLLATSSWDDTVRLWDVESGREVLEPRVNIDVVGAGGSLILRSAERGIEHWRYERPVELRRLKAPAPFGAPARLVLDHEGRRMITGGRNGLLLWDLERGAPVATLHAGLVEDLRWDVEQGAITAAVAGGVYRWHESTIHSGSGPQGGWDFQPGTPRPFGDPRPVWPTPRVRAIALLGPDTLVVGDEEATLVRVSDGTSDAVGPCRGISELETDTAGRWIFAGTWRGGMSRVWDAATREVALEVECEHSRGVFSPDGGSFVLSLGQEARLYRCSDWTVQRRWPRNVPGADLAGPLAFSPDGALLALSRDQYRVDLIRMADGAVVATLANPDHLGYQALAFSGDGSRLVVLTSREQVAVWEMARLRASLAAIGLDWDDAAEADPGVEPERAPIQAAAF